MHRIRVSLVTALCVSCAYLSYHIPAGAAAPDRQHLSEGEDIDGDGWTQPDDCDGSDGSSTAVEGAAWSAVKNVFRVLS
jgi:hypothetical protein